MKIQKYKLFWLFSDIIIITASIISFYLIIKNLKLSIEKDDLALELMLLFIIWSIITILLFDYNQLYKNNVFLTKSIHLINIIKSVLSASISLLLVSFIFNLNIIISNKYNLLLFTTVSFICFSFIRVFFIREIYLLLFNYDIIKHNIVIVGTGSSAKIFATKLLFEFPLKINIIGFFDYKIEKNTPVISGIKCLGNIVELKNFISSTKVDEVILAIDDIDYNQLFNLIDELNSFNLPLRITSEHFDIIPKKIKVEEFLSISLVDIYPKINPVVNCIIKRIIDITVSFIALILLFPLFIMISILIKATSRGPIIYRQKRVGKNGKEFTLYKFRTMNVTEDDLERKIKMLKFIKSGKNVLGAKIINEARVTKIGKILRKYSIDEFPQLINVLLGDMSLVEPRPCLPYEYENYDKWQRKRVKILPGCTGVWQVWGRSNVNFNDSVIMDLYYAANSNPWLDLQIIIKTIPVLLFGKGGK